VYALYDLNIDTKTISDLLLLHYATEPEYFMSLIGSEFCPGILLARSGRPDRASFF